MTDPVPSRRSPAMAVVVTALGSFLIVLALLSIQMRTGQDPALKGARTAAATLPRTIVQRRIIKTRVIITEAPSPGPTTPASAAAGAQAPSTGSAPRVAVPPVQIVQAAPAPVPAPVTRTS
jgi:hypothetical protein